MTRSTTLSVVVPAFNHERFVGAALDSIQGQTLAAGDVVVVDDGSTDHTLEVVRGRARPGLQVVAQSNRGAHGAIDRAIALSRGDYIAILNSDDAFEPERLEHAWAIARATGAALLFGSVRLIDDQDRDLSREHPTSVWYRAARAEVSGARSLSVGLRRQNVAVTTSNFFLHRALWRRLGGFAPHRYVHDLDFLLRAIALVPGQVRWIEELCDVRYRVHGANTITENPDRAMAERAAMLARLARPGYRLRSLLARPRAGRAVADALADTVTIDPMTIDPVTRPVAAPSVRVGIVVRSLDEGGLEEIVGLLAQTLPTRGIETTVLCTHSGGRIADRLRLAQVPVTVGQGRERSWLEWMERERPALLSTHFVDLDVMRVLASPRTPIVETVHNTYAWFDSEGWEKEIAKQRFLAHTIAVSPLVAAYYVRRCGRDVPCRVVPNAVHPGRAARAPRAAARKLLGIPSDVPMFVHVGRVTPQKNLPGLLAAFADLVEVVPTARLLLAGTIDERRTFAALARAHPGLLRSNAVRHVPSVPAVGALLSAADAFVSNSYYEGWSVAASEALWVGLPLVLSDCGGARELVGDGRRGHVVPNALGDPLEACPDRVATPPEEAVRTNRRAFAEALASVASGREAWASRASEIRAHAREALAPERLAAEYARLFRDVLGGREDPRR